MNKNFKVGDRVEFWRRSSGVEYASLDFNDSTGHVDCYKDTGTIIEISTRRGSANETHLLQVSSTMYGSIGTACTSETKLVLEKGNHDMNAYYRWFAKKAISLYVKKRCLSCIKVNKYYADI